MRHLINLIHHALAIVFGGVLLRFNREDAEGNATGPHYKRWVDDRAFECLKERAELEIEMATVRAILGDGTELL